MKKWKLSDKNKVLHVEKCIEFVRYLKAFEVEDITDEYVSKSPLSTGFNQKDDKFRAIKKTVCLKSIGINHKTDVSGVVLGIDNENESCSW